MPPGETDTLHDQSNYYDQIVQRYKDTIAAQFFGHTHDVCISAVCSLIVTYLDSDSVRTNLRSLILIMTIESLTMLSALHGSRLR